MIGLPSTLPLLAALFADRVHVQSTEPACVVEAEVQAALDERFARRGAEAEGAARDRWGAAYRARPHDHDLDLDVTLRAGTETAMQRSVTFAASDCASTPALIAAMVERYFRGIGWTAGAALPALVREPAQEPATSVDVPRSPAPPPSPPDTRAATATAAPSAPSSMRAPAWTLRALAGVTSYPALQPAAAASVEMRAGWLAPEAMVWLPAATTSSLAPGGTAHLDTWSAQLWLSGALDTRRITWRGGLVAGLAFESASTSGLSRPGKRGRTAFDLGVGVHAAFVLTRAFRAGISAWGGRTLAAPEFFLDGPSGTIPLGLPWEPAWKGALALHVDFEFFH